MTIEREFLKKLRYASLLENDLRKELEELLAQPEQEQEPVAWMYKWTPPSTGLLTRSATDYIHMGKDKPFVNDDIKVSDFTPLYLAPPKPKPLTPQQISEGNQSMLNVTREAFKQGVIFAEKAHGITGGEI
jgi:hypothetical protein